MVQDVPMLDKRGHWGSTEEERQTRLGKEDREDFLKERTAHCVLKAAWGSGR